MVLLISTRSALSDPASTRAQGTRHRLRGDDVAPAIATDGDRVFVTGQSSGPNGYDDCATVSYDVRTGRTAWVMRYVGRAGRNDRARAIRTDGKRIYVTGMSAGDESGFDYATVAYRDRT